MAGCIPQKFPSLFFPSVVNTGSTSCSFLLHSLMVLCSKQKASTQEFNFSPHYRILIKMELTGQQLIDAQVRSQSYTLTGFQKQIPPYCHGGLLGIFFFASLGRGEELQKQSHSSRLVYIAITPITRTVNTHSRDGRFWVFNYFKTHLNFDEAQPADTSAYVQFRPCAHSIKPTPTQKDSRARSASSRHEAQDVKEGSIPSPPPRHPPAPAGPVLPPASCQAAEFSQATFRVSSNCPLPVIKSF